MTLEDSVTRSLGKILSRIPAAIVVLASGVAAAQDFPNRPIQLLVPFPAGSAVDTMARPFAQLAARALGQPVVVVNRPGGTQTVAMNALLKAQPDGYTWAYSVVTPVTIAPHRMKLEYTPDSFIPVCQAFEVILYVVVGPGSPFNSLSDLVEHARANPGRVRYGTPGIASAAHLAIAELWQRLGVKLVDVPFAAMDAAAVQGIIKGEMESGIVTTGVVVSQKLRPLAVFAAERQKVYPAVPTVTELGHPILASGYGGIFLRSGTPPAAVARVDEACRRAATDPGYRDIAEKQFQAGTYLDSKAFDARIRADSLAKAALIPTLNLPDH
jgi:tripartite-type tricarboxylate transporter receptor subunit TctC